MEVVQPLACDWDRYIFSRRQKPVLLSSSLAAKILIAISEKIVNFVI